MFKTLQVILYSTIAFVICGVSYGDKSPLQKYKLILNSELGEEAIKSKLLSEILHDMSLNQQRHMDTLKSWSDAKVLNHYGQLSSSSIEDNQKADATVVRKYLAKKIEKRSKNLAKLIWKEMQDKDLNDLKQNLLQTTKLDSMHRKEASHKITKLEESSATNPSKAPSAPYYYPRYRSYYNYYGYNYMHNYGNYTTPYYYSYYRYAPYYRNNYYSYGARRYNSYYYDYYYYPKYNRTVNLLASGLFGVAAVGAFVDWLFD